MSELFHYRTFGLTIQSPFDLGELPKTPLSGTAPEVTFRFGTVPRGRGKTGLHEEISFNTLSARFHIRNGSEIVIEPLPNSDPDALRIVLLGRMMAVLMRQRGWLALHGSAVAVDGRAVVLAGPSGAGKSTTAAALHNAGYEVLTDDVAAVRVVGDRVVICPSWPRLRLFSDSAALIGEKARHSVVELDKHSITLREGSLHRLHEVGAIYILNRGADISSQEIPPVAAIAALSMNSFLKLRRADAECVSVHLRDCASVASLVPVRTLFRPVSLDALPSVVELVERELRGTV